MFQRIKLSEGSVLHKKPPPCKILSREDKINSTIHCHKRKLIKRVILLSVCFTDRKLRHKYLGPYILVLLLLELMYATLFFLCSCKIFSLNPLFLTLLTKLFFYPPIEKGGGKKEEYINLASGSLKVIAHPSPIQGPTFLPK